MKAGRFAFSVTLAAVVLAVAIGSYYVAVQSIDRHVADLLERSTGFSTVGSYANRSASATVPAGADVTGRVYSHAHEEDEADAMPVRYFPAALDDDSSDIFEPIDSGLGSSLPGYVRLADSGGPVQAGDNASIPQQLTPPENAVPIRTDKSSRDAAARKIIKQELPEASEEEREIWFDNLRDLPPDLIRELLRIRTQIGAVGRMNTIGKPLTAPDSASENQLLPPNPSRPRMGDGQDIPLDESPTAVFDTLQTAISAVSLARDIVLNNIANANTVAFKRARVRLTDLAYEQYALPGQQDLQGTLSPVGVAVGLGTRVAATEIDFRNGRLVQTGQTFDVAIVGDGFFQIQDTARTVYSRAGTFTTNPERNLVLASADRGRLLEPPISIPTDAIEILISPEGIVSVRLSGSAPLSRVGQIELAKFVNPVGLVPLGDNLYGAGEASGSPIVGAPGIEGRGILRQGFLEQSNVDVPRELTELKRLAAHLRAISDAMQILSPVRQSASPAGAGTTLDLTDDRSAGRVVHRQSTAKAEEHSGRPTSIDKDSPRPVAGTQSIDCQLSDD